MNRPTRHTHLFGGYQLLAGWQPTLMPIVSAFVKDHLVRPRPSRRNSPAPIEVRKVADNGLLSTAKLKTYPARLNVAILFYFIDRFLKCSARRESVGTFLDDACSELMTRCIEVETQAYLELDFDDYADMPCSAPGHPLARLAEWPDRDAGIGKDYAF